MPGEHEADESTRRLEEVWIGEWLVRPAEGLIERGDEAIRLRPKAMEVLALLAARPGYAVSKERLIAEVWGGDAVEDGALTHCISEIRKALGDSPRDPRYIETLPKRGYRLLAQSSHGPFPPPAAEGPVETLTTPGRARPATPIALAAVAVAVLAAAVIAGLVVRSPAGEERGEPRPRVAVLGFENLSGDPEVRWLSTALTEMLTTELAVSGAVRAVSTDAVARIKREMSIADSERLDADALRKLRAGLGVDYVVAGSYLVPAGDEAGALRVDLRLQDYRSGEIVAATVETGTVAELADLALMAGLHLRRALGEDERLADRRVLSTQSLPAGSTAARLYYRGVLELRRFEGAAAISLLERAVAEEPSAPEIHLALAEAWSLLGSDAAAADAADRALALTEDLPRESRLWAEARGHRLADRWDAAVERLGALYLLDPDNPDYGRELVRAQLHAGSPEQALATVVSLKDRRAGEHRDPQLELLAAEAAARGGDYDRSLAAATSARELARELGAPLATGRAILHEAIAHQAQGRMAEAEAALEEARAIFDEIGDPLSRASAALTLAGWLWERGAYERCETMARTALELYRETGNRAGESNALRQLAMLVWRGGDTLAGERMLLTALDTFRELGNRHGEASVLKSLGIAGAAWGVSGREPAVSPCTRYEQALAIYRELDNRDGIASAVRGLGRCAFFDGEIAKANEAFEEAVALYRRDELPGSLATVLYYLAHSRSLGGEMAAAESHFREGIELFRQIENPRMLAASLAGLGTLRILTADLEEAGVLLEESVRLRREIGDPLGLAASLVSLAHLRVLQEDWERAEKLGREAVARADLAPDRFGDLARQELAHVLLEAGRPREARALLDAMPELVDPHAPIDIGLLAARITFGRALGATGEVARGLEMLREVVAYAEQKGLERYRLEAEVARHEIEAEGGRDASTRDDLENLVAESKRRGLLLLAQRADRLLATG